MMAEDEPQRGESPMEKATRTLELGLFVFSAVTAIAIFAGAVFLIAKIEGDSRSQGGRYYVAVAAIIALGAVDWQIGRLLRRPYALGLATTRCERNYRIVSLLLMFAAAIVLFGLAWGLP